MVSGSGDEAAEKPLDISYHKVGIDSFTSVVVLGDDFGQGYTISQMRLVTRDGFCNLLGDVVSEATVRGQQTWMKNDGLKTSG